MFMGFTPLFGLKTVLCLALAYIFRVNPIAAVVAVSLHDIVTPLWPVLLKVEYDIGVFVLSHVGSLHNIPTKTHGLHLKLGQMLEWTTFLSVGLPLLVGSLFLAARRQPSATASRLGSSSAACVGRRLGRLRRCLNPSPRKTRKSSAKTSPHPGVILFPCRDGGAWP